MLARVDDRGDRLVVVNMNGARRGALSPDLYAAIAEAMEQAADPRIRAVILSSEGGFFCAGGDLNVLIERRQLSEAERREKVDLLHDLIRAIRACPVPVIAAVEGGAAGAGASLALACDLLVAAEDAKFTAAYVKAGLVPDAGLTSALARMLPRQLAMEMCLLARPVTAARMADLGVVNVLATPGEAETQAHALADALAQGPRGAQGVIRRLVAEAYEASEAQQLDAERDAMARAAGGDEAAEGIAAFLDKRKPRF
ncbi:enoyl-CoA hydratase/isomerase family protein [Ruegeria pomeroyi]|uniref:Enoyl-CoA hydratase/isomerase family protein n=2 Tax=Ruegeria pomeroyi TaxID=89184 RepID=Q5LVC5_RUEPO|nr:enoyl-CoA hydratase family protein [Ruegeria pomeroyi]AAV94082.1 enoyl-CoA hydratase/isomerase family protein [Ruegeria pomeroyi DSS-3]NVK98794.1 enoyl-CoA hydratase/isomerase family protein [Ruegeria pomeroyi]NVL00666.1 enoyl-CoA hydratase/isomerase family protein [Ruegeria pomeroyi]QWV07666.1 enoyl-CoA hydratase/isomerase family protein [Ruegeria pomeroyi]